MDATLPVDLGSWCGLLGVTASWDLVSFTLLDYSTRMNANEHGYKEKLFVFIRVYSCHESTSAEANDLSQGVIEAVMSGWGCVHEVNETCTRVAGRPCDPGMRGCVLAGRFRFSNDDKNRPPRQPVETSAVVDTDQG